MLTLILVSELIKIFFLRISFVRENLMFTKGKQALIKCQSMLTIDMISALDSIDIVRDFSKEHCGIIHQSLVLFNF